MSRRDLSGANSRQVTITVEVEDISRLKTAGYALCVAKKVDDGYDVVWHASRHFLAMNTLSWTPIFRLFGTNRFDPGGMATMATAEQTIGFGEQCILDARGVLGRASTGGPRTEITLVNQYGAIHAGLSQMISWIDGSQQVMPIHVSPRASPVGQVHLRPVDSVLVWFDQNARAAEIFSKPPTGAVEINLTHANAATLHYSNGVWSIP
jgi:hypothetical protein